jgi:DNA-binding IclR family transcriptional regulator
VSKVDGNQALSLASAVGRRLPAHATGVGKVLLAGLPESSLDALFRSVRMERFTAQTVADLPSLRKRLARIRRLGYGTDEEEYTIGVRCVAVPIRDQHGVIVAAMSVSAPAVRFDKKRSQEALDLLVDAAAQLSSALGYEGRTA